MMAIGILLDCDSICLQGGERLARLIARSIGMDDDKVGRRAEGKMKRETKGNSLLDRSPKGSERHSVREPMGLGMVKQRRWKLDEGIGREKCEDVKLLR